MALNLIILIALAAAATAGAAAAAANEEPTLLVIRDEPQTGSSQGEARPWNNQQLRRTNSYHHQSIESHHHSYRYMGLVADQSPIYLGASSQEQQQQHHHHHSQPQVESAAARLAPPEGATKGGRRLKSHTNAVAANTKTTRRQHHLQPADWMDGGEQPLTSMVDKPATSNRRAPGRNKKHLVCYYGSWAVYRPDAGKYPVENIDPFLCTHLIYGFTGLSHDNLIKVLDPWNDLEDNYGKGAMKRFTSLKRLNPELKTLVAIGGWNEGSIKYSRMASDPEARARFIKSVLDFLAKYNFDGLDLDWEYPGSRGGHSYDKANFVRLLRELKESFAPHNYLLTAAVSAGKWFIEPAYDIAQVSRHLDLINLMAYDYHGGWEPKTGMNAPLFASKRHDLSPQEQLLNVNWSVNYWLQHGAPREKLMLGVGTYGRSFTLDRPHQEFGLNAPASQKGRAGPYTREPGSLGYNEICEQLQRQPRAWTIVRDPDYLAPYAYNNNERQWVGYDDVESLKLKAQFAQSMGLGGMMVWSLETDDFQGRCHGHKYPLLSALRQTLDGAKPPGPNRPTPAPAASTTAAPRPTAATSTTPGHEVEEDGASSTASSTASTTTSRRPSTQSTSTSRRPPGRPSRRPTTTRPTTTRPTTTTTTTSTSTTTRAPAQQGDQFSCPGDGMFADPSNCRRFVRCVSGYGPNGYTTYRFDCAPGTAFDEERQYCDHIYNVARCKHQHQHQQPSQPLRAAKSQHKSNTRRNWY